MIAIWVMEIVDKMSDDEVKMAECFNFELWTKQRKDLD